MAYVDWLRNELHITGAAPDVARFQQAAAGSGVVPWTLDLDRMEEDFFLPMAAPPERAISVAGARILACRLRDAVAVNHQRALTRRLTDRADPCPFDLHRLLPVPPPILQLGPDDPAARMWLRAHWGTTRALRHVRALAAAGDRRQRGAGRMRIEFWSADWSPWQALRRLRREWPELGLELRPDYSNG